MPWKECHIMDERVRRVMNFLTGVRWSVAAQ